MTQVAGMYGLTVQAVSKAVKDRKIPVPASRTRNSYRQYIPWTIAVEHENHYARRCLRFWAMEQSGKPLRDHEAQMLRKFKEKLDERDLVVQYDPRHPKGPFIYVPRRAGIDTGYVRNPEVP